MPAARAAGRRRRRDHGAGRRSGAVPGAAHVSLWLGGGRLAALGQGIVVGHLLECAAQVSGGYIADPGFVDVPRLDEVGFPLAEVQADGRCVITKLAGTGGASIASPAPPSCSTNSKTPPATCSPMWWLIFPACT
jgi:hypothetical protein